MPSVSQIISASYTALANAKKTPANQWAESAFLAELERQGGIDRRSLSSIIGLTLDYQRNPATQIQATDLAPLSLSKTEVLTEAQYTPAEVVAPFTWSQKDEAQNPTVNQKVNLADALMTNAIDSHDDILEQDLFQANTNGFLGLPTHITTAGTGVDGGIDSTADIFWRNQQATYTDDTDIEAASTTLWNACAKGSGAKSVPTLAVSDGPTQALFEGTQQGLQRYEGQDAKAGFKTLMIKTARWVFSPYGTTTVYFINCKNFRLVVSKEYFRDMSDTIPLANATGWTRRVYSACQSVTDNRSRLGALHL